MCRNAIIYEAFVGGFKDLFATLFLFIGFPPLATNCMMLFQVHKMPIKKRNYIITCIDDDVAGYNAYDRQEDIRLRSKIIKKKEIN